MAKMEDRMTIKEKIQLNEMIYSRQDAIDRCASLGLQFIKHFHKAVKEGIESTDFNYHCAAMQSCYDLVKDMELKSNGKQIHSDNLINWFFTVGSDVETKIEEQYQNTYEQLYLKLLFGRGNSKVETILSGVRYGENGESYNPK